MTKRAKNSNWRKHKPCFFSTAFSIFVPELKLEQTRTHMVQILLLRVEVGKGRL
jgi:hypothetical protein